MSVNVPTNVRQKEQDINQKLQLYGIFEAFSNGKIPSNKQIDIAMNTALQHHAITKPSNKLSSEGRQIVGDLKDVIERAKILLLTKNQGNLIQDFIWQCEQAGTGSATKPGMPIHKGQAKQDGQNALQGLRTLGSLVVSNGQFRKLLNDVVVLARDIAGDAAGKAAHKINPSQDELDNIDEPAEDDTWHDTPDAGGLKESMKSKLNAAKPFDKQGLKNAAQDAKQSGQNEGSNRGGAMSALKTGAQNLKNQARENIPDEDQDRAQEKKEQAKQKAREKRDQTKDYLKEKIPKERRDQAVYRLKKMIVEIQGHPDYSEAVDTLLGIAEKYQGHSKHLAHEAGHQVKGAHDDDGITNAETDLKILIERFANSTSSDDLIDAMNAVYTDADRDPELKGWFKHLDVFIRKCLKEQGYVMQDSADDEWNKIYDQGNHLLNERYSNHTQRLIDEVKFLADQFDQDEQNRAFAESMKKLFTALGNDENGKPTFKPHLVKDLTNVIIPAIFENIRYVPIPRIEYSDPMADAIIENLVIEGDNLAPNVFEFGSDNYFRWGRKTVASKNKNKVMISVSGIQMDLRDVAYYVHKKQGFPSLHDKGVMDIFLGGSGFSFKMALETADKTDSRNFFKVNNVVVDIKHMNIVLKQSSHKLLFNIFKPLLLKVMTPVLTKVVEKVIKDKFNQLDEYMYSIQKEAQKSIDQAKKNPNPENVQNIYKSYFNAFQAKMEKKKQQGKEAAADKAVNIAVTKQDSMFKNINLPGGISTKATEYKELAAKGNKWESPIFSIGSARETSSLPKIETIRRKHHTTAPSEIKGQNNLGQGMDAYSKADESEVFNEGSKYGQTGDYGGESGNHGGKTANYGGQSQSYSSGQGQSYGTSQGQAYGSKYDGQDVYAQDSYSQGNQGGYAQGGQDSYSQGYAQDSYGQANGAVGYNQQYASTGYDASSAGYAKEGYGDASYATGAQAGYASAQPATYSAGQTGGYSSSTTAQAPSAAAYGGTTLGMQNPVLSGRA